MQTRRQFLRTATIATAAAQPRLRLRRPTRLLTAHPTNSRNSSSPPPAHEGDFDERSVDDPIVFYANNQFNMLYIGFDGIGYQTGLATSHDLVTLEARSPRSPSRSSIEVHQIQSRPQLHPPQQRPPLTRRSPQDQRPLPRRMERLPQRRLRRRSRRHRPRMVARPPSLGPHRPHPLPAGRSPLGARRPLPPRPSPLQQHLLPLLQRQDRHSP